MTSIKADRDECKRCVGCIRGFCSTLVDNNFPYECPFLATPERIRRDAELLQKAIREGRVKAE